MFDPENVRSSMSRVMKRSFLVACALVMAHAVMAQVPQFSYKDYADWVYSNPAIELNADNIRNNRIYLYTTSQGLALTLTSPQFNCHVGQVIDMDITWVTDQWQTDGFVVDKVALTAAILNEQGVAVDSVTYTPTSVSRNNYLSLSITVPHGVGQKARLRFASWKADVRSNGAVRQITMTSELRPDVNLDGEVTVADINTVIDVILSGVDDQQVVSRADVNRDGEVTVADINLVIDAIIG